MKIDADKQSKKKFKTFDETFSLCALALAIAFLYPNKANARKRAVISTVIILFNGGQIFWFTIYTSKCLYTLDILNFARNMTLAVVVILFFFKTYYVIYATEDFASILCNMSRDFLAANDLDEDYQAIYEEHIQQGKVAELSWLFIPIILAAQFPIYAGICMSIESIKTDAFTRLMVHDMELMFVEDIQSETPFFECIFAYNCIQCIILVPNYCGFDGSFGIATTHLRMKQKLMAHKVHRAFTDAQNTDELHKQLKEAIKDHQDALRFYEKLQKVYGPWLLAVFMLTSFMISFNLYMLYLLKRVDPKYTLFGLFGVLHIYLPCHYASTLAKVGEEIATELYDAPWENWSDPVTRRLLMLMIARGQKTMIITGNGLVVFNMALFKAIIQSSYSFFTLITA